MNTRILYQLDDLQQVHNPFRDLDILIYSLRILMR